MYFIWDLTLEYMQGIYKLITKDKTLKNKQRIWIDISQKD
jgi:hypothetical protein